MALDSEIPSKDYDVLKKNMENTDEFVNSTAHTFTNRPAPNGNETSRTIAGINADAQEQINRISGVIGNGYGYVLVGAFIYVYDLQGAVVPNGKLYTYETDGVTLKTTYSDANKTIANPNPVILDAGGQAAIYIDGVYKMVLDSSADVEIWSAEPILATSNSADIALSCNTLNDLISGADQLGGALNFSFLASRKAVVKTNFNNLHALNDSPSGGADYQILTAADYGGTPDGETIGGVVAGADHYIGGGTDYVAKYLPVDNVIDAEALGYFSGHNTGTDFSDATAVFDKVLDYAQERPIKLQAKQNYYYNNTYGSFTPGVKRHIEIIGSGMPVLERNPNAPSEYNRLIGGTRIRGRLSLACTSCSLREFGVDGAPEATNSWPYDYDALSVKTYDTARSDSCYFDKLIALGKAYDTPAHALIISGFNNTIVTDCQGYSTWFGISVDMRNSVITNFIGGNNERNVVNLKSHQPAGSQGDRFNQTCSVTGVAGLNPTTPGGDNFGTACIAIEADGNNLERVVVGEVSSVGFTSSIAVVPFNGAVMTNVTIGRVTSDNTSDPTDLLPDIYVEAGSGGGSIQNLHLSDIQLQNVSYQAMRIKNVTLFSCDNFFANTGIGGVGVAPTINTNFVEIDSTVLSASLDGFTLVNSFGLTSGTGQGTIQWNNTAANNRKGARMLCVNTGTGAP